MSMVRHDDLVREALAYILEARAGRAGVSLSGLLDEAGMRYNLSPLDAERLGRLLRDEAAAGTASTLLPSGRNAGTDA